MATVDQQRELMQYTRKLNERIGREVGERHGDMRRLRGLFEQIGRDVRDWQDGEFDTPDSEPKSVSEQRL
jgi:hypothetical protein